MCKNELIKKYCSEKELADEFMTESMLLKIANHRAEKQPIEKPLKTVAPSALMIIPKLSKEEIEAKRVDEKIQSEKREKMELFRKWEIFKNYIPKKFHKAKLSPFVFNRVESPNQKRVLNELFESGVVKKPKNILFTGASGIGKTHFSVALGIRYIHDGITPRFLQDKHFVKGEEWYRKQYYNSDFLILDDVMGDGDYGRIAHWESKLIRDLVYERSDANKPTLISTNFTKSELHKYLGNRAWSRFVEDCVFIDFGFDSVAIRGLR